MAERSLLDDILGEGEVSGIVALPDRRVAQVQESVMAGLWRVRFTDASGARVADYVEVAKRLDGVPGVAGIELNISCPNVGKGGLQFAIDAGAAAEVTAAVRRATDLPLLVKLSPNVADVRPIAKAIAAVAQP